MRAPSEPSASRRLTRPCSHSCFPVEPGANSSWRSTPSNDCLRASSCPGRSRRLLGRPAAGPAGIAVGIAAARSGVCSTLQLRPVPGSPTVVRGPPLRFTGTLKEAPRPPTEIELSPPLEKLNLSGPRRAERRKRKPMAISDQASSHRSPASCPEAAPAPPSWRPAQRCAG